MEPEELYWKLVNPLLKDPAIKRSTMLGLTCLRLDDSPFVAFDPEEHLVVKLPVDCVEDLVIAGEGNPFSHNGRVMREWVAFEEPDEYEWRDQLEAARLHAHALGVPAGMFTESQ